MTTICQNSYTPTISRDIVRPQIQIYPIRDWGQSLFGFVSKFIQSLRFHIFTLLENTILDINFHTHFQGKRTQTAIGILNIVIK